ncbi:hypothetical protein CPA57_01745 [Bombella sp. TMW2.1880]|uniref:Uncharacterized protein n=1 Tax=Bombella favorum TaxID=2039164 RepID=A0ABR5ZLA3_9PROT|nr:hypothetical protein [Bombella favorum]
MFSFPIASNLPLDIDFFMKSKMLDLCKILSYRLTPPGGTLYVIRNEIVTMNFQLTTKKFLSPYIKYKLRNHIPKKIQIYFMNNIFFYFIKYILSTQLKKVRDF